MCNNLKKYRTLSGQERREAMRAHLTKKQGITFNEDPHALTVSQQTALAEMAKAVTWRKSITSPMSLGLSFFVYLARDIAKTAHIAAQAQRIATASRSIGRMS